MPKRFVVGDIHGAYRALMQCLDRSKFNYLSDTLIALGDVSDGWPETKRCVDELLKIKNLIYLLGNHDLWTLNYMKSRERDHAWLIQGGDATISSYEDDIPASHKNFFHNALLKYELENKIFVHAGILPHRLVEDHDEAIFLWDRSLARMAMDFKQKGIEQQLTSYDEIYIGHTPVDSPLPIKACNVWLMDTGAGWNGCLSMMNIDSKEFFVSDKVPTLYPEASGRIRF